MTTFNPDYARSSGRAELDTEPTDETQLHETGRDALKRWGLTSADDTGVVPAYDEFDDDYGQYDDYETRQRERFGGINWGAGFFGWVVAVVMSVLLIGVAAAAFTALGRVVPSVPAMLRSDTRSMALVVGVVLVAVVMTAYYAGGYVAGRMSRFDGGKQGAGVWVTGILLTTLGAGLGLVFGAQFNVLDHLHLPSSPLPPGAGGPGGVVAAVVALIGCLLTAIGGGKVGCRYHQKVDDFR